MSKYKYSSLLSSQYRQVFNSYHSLDKCEKELKDNDYKSLHKRLNTEKTKIDWKYQTSGGFNFRLNFSDKKPEIFLYFKTQARYADSSEILKHRKEQFIADNSLIKGSDINGKICEAHNISHEYSNLKQTRNL